MAAGQVQRFLRVLEAYPARLVSGVVHAAIARRRELLAVSISLRSAVGLSGM